MKILCDVHLPKKLVELFKEKGINAVHGSEILDGWTTKDKDFCKYADDNNFIFITKDSDFRNSHFLKGTPQRLIKINLGNISNDKLISIFHDQFSKLEHILKHPKVYIEINMDSVSVLLQ